MSFCVFLRTAFAWAEEHSNWKHLAMTEQEKSLCLHPSSCKLYTSVIEVKHCPTVTIWQSFLTALTGIYPCSTLKWIRWFSKLQKLQSSQYLSWMYSTQGPAVSRSMWCHSICGSLWLQGNVLLMSVQNVTPSRSITWPVTNICHKLWYRNQLIKINWFALRWKVAAKLN